MKRVITFLVILFTTLSSLRGAEMDPEKGIIKGRVVDNNGLPVIGAYINDLDISVREQVLGTMFTDETGTFQMEVPVGSKKAIVISCLGYHQLAEMYALERGQTKDFGDCQMEVNPKELQTIVVKGTPVNVRTLPDGFSVDVRHLVSTSNNALDLLERLPQLLVDNRELKVLGKETVIVRFNNVIQKVDGKALSDILQSLDPRLIDSVDVITSPPLKYDREGNAAMITLHMSPLFNKYAGGSVDAHISKSSRYNGSVSAGGVAMFNDNKLYVQIRPFMSHDCSTYEENVNKVYDDNTTIITRANPRMRQNRVVGMAEVQYQYNDKGYIGFNADVQTSKEHEKFPSTELMKDVLTINRNDKENSVPRIDASIFAEHAFSKQFKGWLDAAYYNYKENSINNFNGIEETATEPFMSYNSNDKLRVNGLAVQNDYSLSLDNSKHNFDFGVRVYYTHTSKGKNSVQEDQSSGIIKQDDLMKLEETTINPYLSYTWNPSNRLRIRLGSQVQYSHRRVTNLEIKNKDLEYSSYLPDFLASWSFGRDSRLSFVISSGAGLPRFNHINPFKFRVDQHSYTVGNMSLRSQTAYYYSLTYLLGSKFSVMTYVNQIRNMITTVGSVVDNDFYSMPRNAQHMVSYGIRPYYYFNRLWWMTVSASAFGEYKVAKGIIPEVARRETSYRWGGSLSTDFVFNKERTFEGSLSFSYTGRSHDVATIIEPSYRLSAYLSLYLLDRKLSIYADFSYLLSSRNKTYSYASGYKIWTNYRLNFPTLRLNIAYRFNNIKEPSSKRREVLNDIKSRI